MPHTEAVIGTHVRRGYVIGSVGICVGFPPQTPTNRIHPCILNLLKELAPESRKKPGSIPHLLLTYFLSPLFLDSTPGVLLTLQGSGDPSMESWMLRAHYTGPQL